MPKGSNLKGQPKSGGRSKGTPNRRTIEKVEQARVAVEQAKGRNVKLGKEVLEEFMMIFRDYAAQHQPLPAGVSVPPGRTPDEAKFITYATLAVKTAKDLADFQSPKFKAITVVAPPPETRPGDDARVLNGSNVVQLKDPVAIARVYAQMVKRVV